MNLRDQFLKAGLASKKQAKQAETSVRLDRRKNLKDGRNGVTLQEDEVRQKIKDELQERKEKDRELNLDLERQRREQEKQYQAREIIISHDLRDRYAKITYRFIVDSIYIKAINVTHPQLRCLAEGELGIAMLNREEDEFYLLELADCKRIKEMYPDFIVCLHAPLAPGETLDYSLVDDEYYSRMFREEFTGKNRGRSGARDSYQSFRRDNLKLAKFG